TEDVNDPGISEHGILISKIRGFKTASTLDSRSFTYTGHNVVAMAESMAFNSQTLGMIGGMMSGYKQGEIPEYLRTENPYTWGRYRSGYGWTEERDRYLDFFRKQFRYYRDIDRVADVAVLHSYATMTFNEGRPYDATFLFEQALIENHVPFDVIFDDQLADLSRYRVLVLADQEALSDEQLEQVRKFVSDGGGLVATGATSLLNEDHRQRRDFGLKDLFGVEAPVWLGFAGPKPDGAPDLPTVQRTFGRGKVVYLNGVIPAMSRPPGEPMTSKYWKTPKNSEELI
ncbi:MAG: hypothetical protein GY953_56210, partial [bacterium]|nr:hypothetical protein [bacterium]